MSWRAAAPAVKYFERITMKVVADLDPPAYCSYYSFRDMVVGAIKAS